jgi:hypothetical protein
MVKEEESEKARKSRGKVEEERRGGKTWRKDEVLDT